MKQKKGFVRWIQSGKVNRNLCIFTFMLVPLLLLIVFTYIPFGKMVQFSFYDMKYIGARKFVGWKNYIDVFTRDDCFRALKISIYYIFASFIQLGLALYFATILSFKTKCSGLFKGFMFFPYLVCGIAVGFVFKFFYTRGFVLDTVLQWCGFQLDNLPYWLKDTRINNISVAATSIWRYMGQQMVLFIGAIMSVDSSLYEAAEVDGATASQIFTKITLPLLRPIMIYVMITSLIGGMQMFDVPQILTNGTGDPMRSTMTLIMFLNKHLFSKNYGMGGALSVCLFIITGILSLIVFRFNKTKDDRR